MLVFLIIQSVFFFLILFLVVAFITGAPFVPTPDSAARIMIKISQIKPGMKVYDLGSGDGRLLFLASEMGAISTGFEINPFLVFYTYIRSLITGSRNTVRIRWCNFWNADLSDADVIFIYLVPWQMEKLEKKLKNGCKPGTIIVSNSFVFPSLDPINQDIRNHIYTFRIGS